MGAHSKLAKHDTAEALRVIVRACGYKERSSAEIRARLMDKGFDLCTAQEALSKAVSYGYINDQRFKESLIRTRINQGKGLYGIKKELELHDCKLQEGDCELVELLGSSEVSTQLELERAISLLQRKPSKSKNPLNASYAMLIRNGYSFDIAKRAAFEFARHAKGSLDQC